MTARVRWLVAVLCVVPALAARAQPSEWEVKAAFLYNFGRFVEWPEDTLPPSGSPFVVAVLGNDPFGPVLDEMLAGKSVAGHRVAVKRIARAEDGATAQILFLGSPEPRELAQILRALEGASVLTVGDAEGAAERGVMVNFRIRDSRVRFEINLARAERARLKISSQLLKLAILVVGTR